MLVSKQQLLFEVNILTFPPNVKSICLSPVPSTMMMVKCFANEQDDCGDQQVDVKGRPSKTPREPNLHQPRHTPPPPSTIHHHHHPTIPPSPHYTPPPALYTIHTRLATCTIRLKGHAIKRCCLTVRVMVKTVSTL